MRAKTKRMLSLLCSAVLFAALPIAGCSPSDQPAESGGPDADPAGQRPWWDSFPSYCHISDDYTSMKYLNSVANITTGGFMDEGRGPVFQDYDYYSNLPLIESMVADGYHPGAWLEGQGTTDAILGALHQNVDGSFEMMDNGEIPNVISHAWAWDYNGPEHNSYANYKVWFSVDSFVNQQPWNGRYLEEADMLPEPTYPDGTSALGYKDNDSSNPFNSYLYDALAGKDINGKLTVDTSSEVVTQSNTWKIPYMLEPYEKGNPEPEVMYLSHLAFYKDNTSDFWVQYNIYSAKRMMERGVRSFWVDNYTGFDYASWVPVASGFGDWSVAGFREYIKDYPELGIEDPDSFDIRTYLKDVFKEHFPDLDPSLYYEPSVNAAWRAEFWASEPVWNAYRAFKHKNAKEKAQMLYDGIKNAAKELGIDPDEVVITGNDIPRMMFGSMDGTEVDMVSSEYTSHWSTQTGFDCDGIPPVGGCGTTYKTVESMFKSRHSIMWYYLQGENEKYIGKNQLGITLGYEALINNAMICFGHGVTMMAGNDDVGRKVNGTIRAMADVYGERELYASIGLLHSGDTMSMGNTPTGTQAGEKRHAADYYGWGQALENMNMPYRVVQDSRLEEQLEGLKLLILPSTLSASDEVAQTILRFVEEGGCVIYTSKDTGLYDSFDNNFRKRDTAELAEKLAELESTYRVKFVDADYSVGFYKKFQDGNCITEAKELATAVASFADKGVNREFKLKNFDGRVGTALHYDAVNNRMFIDFVNKNIDPGADTVTACKGGTVKILPIEGLVNQYLKATVYNEEGQGTELEISLLKDGYWSVTLPEFVDYCSLVIEVR